MTHIVHYLLENGGAPAVIDGICEYGLPESERGYDFGDKKLTRWRMTTRVEGTRE